MADKFFKCSKTFKSSFFTAFVRTENILCTACLNKKFVCVSTRFASRLSTLSKSISKSKETKEPSVKIRPRIKSLSKEHPPEKEQDDLLCLTYSTGERYHLLGLRDSIYALKDKYTITALPKDARDVLHVCTTKKDQNGTSTGDIFFFRWLGAVVFWNIESEEILQIQSIIRRFEESSSYENEDIEEESEEIPYSYCKNGTSFVKGRINLNQDASNEMKALEKFAFSNAIALSVKLGIWESELEKYIDSIAWVPDALSKGVKLRMSRKEILEKTGELISLRYKINLYSDLLMTPDFYWDREDLGYLYESMCSYMEVRRRTKVMNEKLNHCNELAELLRTHLSEKHSFNLEWGIIVLIAIEIVFEIIHLIENHFPLS
ncbi:required for meiotic nuclear division protein 1 homolog [Actinia tenebrosa]|uniref:Required for meiotic nuclear division protein 1 homolog n=1 Tax=Actinia tenebrosa TaxID=6105 RepID=A0A6P8H518_ACTTE|nr:required for meiotic nuclear division protein 1 homolog [Actinia tenebrosa]